MDLGEGVVFGKLECTVVWPSSLRTLEWHALACGMWALMHRGTDCGIPVLWLSDDLFSAIGFCMRVCFQWLLLLARGYGKIICIS